MHRNISITSFSLSYCAIHILGCCTLFELLFFFACERITLYQSAPMRVKALSCLHAFTYFFYCLTYCLLYLDRVSGLGEWGTRKLPTPGYAFCLPDLERLAPDFRNFLEKDLIETPTQRRLEASSAFLRVFCRSQKFCKNFM